jgi:hypothetical protein
LGDAAMALDGTRALLIDLDQNRTLDRLSLQSRRPRDLPQARHRLKKSDSEHGGFLRLTEDWFLPRKSSTFRVMKIYVGAK